MTDFEYTAEPTPLNTQRIHSGTDPIEYTAEPHSMVNSKHIMRFNYIFNI